MPVPVPVPVPAHAVANNHAAPADAGAGAAAGVGRLAIGRCRAPLCRRAVVPAAFASAGVGVGDKSIIHRPSTASQALPGLLHSIHYATVA